VGRPPIEGFSFLCAGGIAGHPPMAGGDREETIVQVHGIGPWGITYVNEADDPRKK
jgi:hypothetical protein